MDDHEHPRLADAAEHFRYDGTTQAERVEIYVYDEAELISSLSHPDATTVYSYDAQARPIDALDDLD